MAVTGTNITLTTRTAKGSALTHAELDANQTGLKDAVEGHSHDEFAAELGADDNYMTYAEKAKLSGIEAGAEVNVQADWNASTGDTAILNKPSIPSISGLLNEAAHDALDHSGLPGVPVSYTLPVASATVLGGVKVDGTTVLISDGIISSTGGSGGGVTDHGLLTGLSDDDHSQYHNDTRGDARYSRTTHNHNLSDLTEKSYNSLTDKPSIPSITGLLDETAHDALDHTGLTGIPTAYSLPTASTTVLGGVKVDGTSVTINSGVISASGSLSNPMTAAGDIIIGGESGAPTRLAKGIDGQVLGYVGGTVVPVDAPSGGGASIQQATVTLSQYASTNITATAIIAVSEQVSGASLIPAMTSNTAPSGTASADSSYSGSYAYLAVDGSAGSAWNSLSTAFPHWLEYDGVLGIAVQYSIDCVLHQGQAPKTFELRHSADNGSTWSTLDSRYNITDWTAQNTYTIATPAETSGGIYQLYVTAGIDSTELVIHGFALVTAPTYQNMLSADYKINRFSASGSQVQVLTRLKTGSAAMVIDYI